MAKKYIYNYNQKKLYYYYTYKNAPIAFYIPSVIYLILGTLLPTHLSKKWIQYPGFTIKYNIADYCGRGY